MHYASLFRLAVAGNFVALRDTIMTFGDLPKVTAEVLTDLSHVVDAHSAKTFAAAHPGIVPHLLCHVLSGTPFWQMLFTSAERLTAPAQTESPVAKTNVAIAADDCQRRIFKIIPLSDGGFAVTAPYHKVRAGMLLKTERDYATTGFTHVPFQQTMTFTASDRVKLSYHVDGFVQFSGEQNSKIVSGRDATTGEPRGLGLIARPLTDPVKSGPSVGCVVWGLADFDVWKTRADEYNICFGDDELYKEPVNQQDAPVDAYHVSMFVFPYVVLRDAIGTSNTQDELDMKLPMNIYNRNAPFRVKLVRISADTVLGLIAKKDSVALGSSSGFQLSSPSDRSCRYGMNAIYPPLPIDFENAQSLDREPSFPRATDS
jgi:hypothetical protein